MAFIKTRKKIVSSALLSVMASATMAEDVALDTIHSQADVEAQKSLKVDQSANSKFVAPLLDTPKSVSVISQQLIKDTQVTTLADALRTVPGITLGAGEGGNSTNGDRPIIRGYSAESSMYVDGVRNNTSQNRDMFAVEQVEVTKGSSSSMGGGGNVGGSINMVSKVAKKGDALEGSVSAGTDNYQRISLDANKDFGNGIAARVAVMGHHNEKAGQNDGAEYKRAGIAPSISFGLDTDTRATLSYYYLKTDDTPDSGVPYWDKATGTATGKPLTAKQGIYYGWLARDFQKQENQIGTLKLEHDLTNDITLSNTTTYSNSKNNYLWTQPDDSQKNIATDQVWRRLNSRISDTDTFSNQLSLAGLFKTGAFTHRFNTGVEYSNQETDKDSYSVTDSNTSLINGKACTLANPNGWCTSAYNPNPRDAWLGTIVPAGSLVNTETETISLYVLDSIELNPQWLLDLGVRWDKFETTQKTKSTGAKIDSDNDFFSYQAGLTYKPRENGAVYFSYATSATPPGIMNDGPEVVDGNNANLDPEDSRTFEIGTKWDLLQDKLSLNAAIFRTEKNNARVQLTPTTYANVGESKVDGFEIGLNGNITEKWAVSAGYTYLDSEATDNGNTCGRGATVCTPGNASNGNHMANVPENSASLWTTYALTPAFTVGAGAFAVDKVYGDLANTKYVPGYVRYDAMARYNVNENVDLQLNVNNLSDERYFTKAYASHYATEAEGRNAVLAVNFKY
jgi:catecholate siderophore receptor